MFDQLLKKLLLLSSVILVIWAIWAAVDWLVSEAGARPALAPMGYVTYCQREPEHCRPGSDTRIEMTPEIIRVNKLVNRSIRPADDAGDVWQANVTAGDCEDYALTKRAKLIGIGYPAGALRIAVVKTADGQDHAVLIVRTFQGDFALDNLTDAVKPFDATGYKLVKVATSDPMIFETE